MKDKFINRKGNPYCQSCGVQASTTIVKKYGGTKSRICELCFSTGFQRAIESRGSEDLTAEIVAQGFSLLLERVKNLEKLVKKK